MDYHIVPKEITQQMADAVGCDIQTYQRIVAVASLFVPADCRVVHFTTGNRPPLYLDDGAPPSERASDNG